MRFLSEMSPFHPIVKNQVDRFHVCRVLEHVALFKVEAAPDLPTAKRRLKRLAERIPGAYIIFNQKTREVVAESISR